MNYKVTWNDMTEHLAEYVEMKKETVILLIKQEIFLILNLEISLI